METDFSLGAYRFDLPERLIAQRPLPERGTSRLMVLPRRAGPGVSAAFAELGRFLPAGALLVANNSRVVPARLFGRRPSGGRVECLVLTPVPLLEQQAAGSGRQAGGPLSGESGDWSEAVCEALLRASKRPVLGERLFFAPSLHAVVLEHFSHGRARLLLHWQGGLPDRLREHGVLPLPPYIKRSQGQRAGPGDALAVDAERYQTVYARWDKSGSVAAPTAGLHFTRELCASLLAAGIQWAELTLHVGYGTFNPVRCPDIREHVMHAEYLELPGETGRLLAAARSEGRPVIAVGTTACRALEGICRIRKNVPAREAFQAFSGWINSFLYPGCPFALVDGLITNFHLPESSLLMLVAALAGRQRVLDAYGQAVAGNFRFFSYGDAMFIQP